MSKKVRKTLTLDPEVVAMFDGDAGALSAKVNEVLHKELERVKRHEALSRFVAELEATCGPADPAEVERIGRKVREIEAHRKPPGWPFL